MSRPGTWGQELRGRRRTQTRKIGIYVEALPNRDAREVQTDKKKNRHRVRSVWAHRYQTEKKTTGGMVRKLLAK